MAEQVTNYVHIYSTYDGHSSGSPYAGIAYGPTLCGMETLSKLTDELETVTIGDKVNVIDCCHIDYIRSPKSFGQINMGKELCPECAKHPIVGDYLMRHVLGAKHG